MNWDTAVGFPACAPQTPGWGLETSWLLEAAHLAPSRPPHEKRGPTQRSLCSAGPRTAGFNELSPE